MLIKPSVIKTVKQYQNNSEHMTQLNDLAISDSGFIFNPATGESFSSNQTGLFILDQLKQGKEQEEIIDLMMEKFHAERIEMEKDFADFWVMLEHYHLINNK